MFRCDQKLHEGFEPTLLLATQDATSFHRQKMIMVPVEMAN